MKQPQFNKDYPVWEVIENEKVNHYGWPNDELRMIGKNWIFNGRIVHYKDDLVE